MTSDRNYRVDSFVTGKSIKAPVILVTTVPEVLNGEQTIDTVALLVGDRVLVAAQADPAENGIYTVERNAWQRAGDWDGNRDATDGTLVISAQPAFAEIVEIWQMRTVSDPFEPGVSQAFFTRLDSLLNETGSFTINWQGFTTAEVSTMQYRKVGNLVLLSDNSFVSGVSNFTTKTSDTDDMPESIRPSVAQIGGQARVSDNGGAAQYGDVEIFGTGDNIRVHLDAANTLWTASGNASLQMLNLMYYV